MKRFGRVLRLRPGMRENYELAHREVWPAVAEAIAAAGIRNYSIYYYHDWLFSYFELPDETDLAVASKKALESEACRRWEKQMQELQEPLPESGDGNWWVNMDELWHFNP
jgi:L-rhamnose mutarotase